MRPINVYVCVSWFSIKAFVHDKYVHVCFWVFDLQVLVFDVHVLMNTFCDQPQRTSHAFVYF